MKKKFLKNRRVKSKIRDLLTLYSLKALGRSAPNPPVACVIVNKRLGRLHYYAGSSHPIGGPHAEIVALRKVAKKNKQQTESETKTKTNKKNRKNIRKANRARLYVTLEPCNESGRTGPCTTAILKHPTVQKILAFRADPALKVPSIAELNKHSGIQAVYLQAPKSTARNASATISKNAPQNDPKNTRKKMGESKTMATFLEGYIRRIERNRPRLHLKLAVDANFLMGIRGQKTSISGRQGISLTHLLRAQCDAVLFGPNTILTDQPDGSLRKSALRNLRLGTKDYSETLQKDYLLQQVLYHHKALLKMYSKQIHDYQPVRIFLIGGGQDRSIPISMSEANKEKYNNFFAKQDALEQMYPQKKSKYLFLENCVKQWQVNKKPSWPNVHYVLPDLHHPDFGKKILQTLADLSCNEVLVEGGCGLHNALQNDLQKGDRIYILQSKKSLALKEGETRVAMPQYFHDLQFTIEQQLREDLLQLHVV